VEKCNGAYKPLVTRATSTVKSDINHLSSIICPFAAAVC
jgi:hypothetical protein